MNGISQDAASLRRQLHQLAGLERQIEARLDVACSKLAALRLEASECEARAAALQRSAEADAQGLALEPLLRSQALRYVAALLRRRDEAAHACGALRERIAEANAALLALDARSRSVQRLRASLLTEAQAQQALASSREADLAWLARRATGSGIMPVQGELP